MSVYKDKRSPFWQYDFQIKGNRFYGSTGAKTKREAERIEELERKKARRELAGEERGPQPTTLDAAAGLYWIEIGQHESASATTDYQLERLIHHFGKTTALHEISDAELAGYVATRRGQKSKRKRPPSPATINRELELLRRVLYRARDVHAARVPLLDWKRHRMAEPDLRTRALTEQEEKDLVAAAAEHLRDPIAFSLLTGVRLSNALKLDWSQIDLQAQQIVFRVKSRKPGGKTLVLPIEPSLLVLLVRQGPKAKGRVFLRDGDPIKSWRTAWEGARRRAGVHDFRWHDLRHTFGTRLRRAGVDLADIKDLMAHESIATTLRYAQAATDAKRQALAKLPAPALPEHTGAEEAAAKSRNSPG